MGSSARPWKRCGIIGYTSTNGIEIDVTVTVQDVTFAVDEARFVTSFPQCATATMPYVELTDVLATELLHKTCVSANCWRRDKQMDVVVHQDICMKLAVRVQ
jgi:hypothetical protein